jgi:hypothetical protein
MTAHGQQWGNRGDVVTNYGRMLAANPDASALWLHSSPDGDTHNLELVLQRPGDADADGGRALAQVVENGLTHPTFSIIRGNLMETSIEVIGDQGAIHNPHLNQALAEGVAHNMDVVDRVVSDNWLFPEDRTVMGQEVPAAVRDVHVLLREVMQDDGAAATVAGAVEDFMLSELRQLPEAGLPANANGLEPRTDALRQIGVLHGVVAASQGNVEMGSIEDQIAREEARTDTVNFLVGLIPYGDGAVGTMNDLADIAGVSVGEWGDVPDGEDLRSVEDAVIDTTEFNNAILLAVAQHPELATTSVWSMTGVDREEFYAWATSPGVYDAEDHEILRANTWDPILELMGDT